jgi:hypothetical protein
MKALTLAFALCSTAAMAENRFKEPGALLDASEQERPQMLSFFAGLPYGYLFYGFPIAVGARYYIPILKNGFIPPVNDEFGIEFGADFSFFLGRQSFLPFLGLPVEVLWRFHFTENFDAYAKLGLALRFGFGSYYNGFNTVSGVGVDIDPVSAVGLVYKLSSNIALRAEVGYPWIKVGIGILF